MSLVSVSSIFLFWLCLLFMHYNSFKLYFFLGSNPMQGLALIEVLIEAWGISSTIWKSQTDGTAVSGPCTKHEQPGLATSGESPGAATKTPGSQEKILLVAATTDKK